MACVALGAPPARAPLVGARPGPAGQPRRRWRREWAPSPRCAAAATPGAGGDLVAWRELSPGGAPPAWPAPLSAPQRLARSARFWRAAAPLLLRYKLLQVTSAQPAAWAAAHAAGAAAAANTLAEERGFFCKAAQLVATRPDLFPAAYAAALAPFQDALPPMPAALTVRVVEAELLGGAPLSSAFASFDAEPLGSASIAQVHRAVLRSSGAEVAVKVQRPSIEPLLRGDVDTLVQLADVSGRADFGQLLRALRSALAQEFDFEQEARCMDEVATLLAAQPGGAPVRVPRPLMAARRCLVMEYVDGTPVSRMLSSLPGDGRSGGAAPPRAVSGALLRALTDAYAATMLRGGLLHGDPHPGNVMLCADGRVALIDWGLTARLEPSVLALLARLILAVDATPPDAAAVAAAVRALGFRFLPTCADPEAAAAALALWLFGGATELPGGFSGSDLARSPMAQLATVPAALVLVLRSAVLIRGLAARAGVPWSLAREWAPAARDALQPPPVQQRRGADRVRAAWAALLAALRRLVLAAARLFARVRAHGWKKSG